jgi:hypothetical protein
MGSDGKAAGFFPSGRLAAHTLEQTVITGTPGAGGGGLEAETGLLVEPGTGWWSPPGRRAFPRGVTPVVAGQILKG